MIDEKNKLINELLSGLNINALKRLIIYKRKTFPKPRKTVKQLIKNYEENIISPPDEYKDDFTPIPPPRTKKRVKKLIKNYEENIISPPDEYKDDFTPIPPPRTKKRVKKLIKNYEENIISPPDEYKDDFILIEKTAKALKGYTTSYNINIINTKDPLLQLQNTRLSIKNHIEKVLTDMKGIKLNETLKVTFWKYEKEKIFGRILQTAYFNSKPQTIINDNNISESLKLTKQQILNSISQWINNGSGWMIKSIDSHHIKIVKYQPIKGSSYIKLTLELRNSAKGLINLKNNDNECFRWCHIRYLNPQDKYPQRIKKM